MQNQTMRLLTTGEVAQRENCSPRRIVQLIKDQRITGIWKTRRDWVIREDYIITEGTRGPKRKGK